ncbi:hypothetical protein BSLG_003721 [Batrachochytrium salamandrivorans]|nr:hypothetical protein BSLG_003721 [Batrachochytrium salamandrivorans]
MASTDDVSAPSIQTSVTTQMVSLDPGSEGNPDGQPKTVRRTITTTTTTTTRKATASSASIDSLSMCGMSQTNNTVDSTDTLTAVKEVESVGVSSAAAAAAPVKPPRIPLKKPTLLDIDHLEATNSNFLGIYIIAQVCLVLFMVCSCHLHYVRVGTLFDPVVYDIVFSGFPDLMVAELRLLLSTLPALFIQQAFATEFIPETSSLSVLAVWESTWLLYWVVAISTSQFAWPQRAVLAIQMVTLLMKQHSFMAVNNELRRSHHNYKKTPLVRPDSAEPSKTPTEADTETEPLKSTPSTHAIAVFDHQAYPRNLAIPSFFYWLAVPSLVYQTAFPKMPAFRPIHFTYYFGWFLVSSLGLYITLDHLIYPTMRDISINGFYHTFMYLIPGTVMYVVLVFLVVFEYSLNAMAELTLFDERDFYGDWWNALGYESFSRKWATIVHRFLHKHVYVASKESFDLSRPVAMVVTFIVSGFLHELIMCTVLGTFQIDLFRMQALQVLYIWMDYKMPPAKKSYGITGFWGGYFLGPPFAIISYSRRFFE